MTEVVPRSLLLCCCLLLAAARAEPPSLALFYGSPVPAELLAHFDRVVLQPESVSRAELAAFGPSEVYAYLSVGEVGSDQPWQPRLDSRWLLGANSGWQSRILDPAEAGWQALLLERADALWRRGFRGLFLDTLDSYERILSDPEARAVRQAALCELIETLHQRLPGLKLLLNRGFLLLPRVASFVTGLVAESLFEGWDPAASRYRPVPEADRRWLLDRLREARDRYHLPVAAVDYLPAAERARARDTARKIADLGITPWVSTVGLDTLGLGALEPVSRRVLALYDGAEEPGIAFSSVHRLAALPLEYLGFAVDYWDVRAPLPSYPLAGRYAGIVTWFTDDELPAANRLRNWLLSQVAAGIRIAILDHLGFWADPPFLKQLGLSTPDKRPSPPYRVARASAGVGFEGPLSLPARALPRTWQTGPGFEAHLELLDGEGQRSTVVATAPWGGFALAPFVIETGFEDHERWILNPFDFLQRALALPTLPVPDLTTENGRRLLLVHIDGDGFASRAELPGSPLAGQVILDRILRPFTLPTTVSVIEGELGMAGLHRELSPELETIARQIFQLPHVEIASHSFSHPFNWERSAGGDPERDRYHLSIPGYQFDLRREITGSIDYIRRQLAPPEKPVRLFLWSGDALPGREALALVRQAGLGNLNGGNTAMTREFPSLTEVSPTLRPVDGELQVYAPVQNENVFTHNWNSPFYGYRKAIETFQLIDQPRRLKPIAIYYHFYSGTKEASLKALDEVYRWALSQSPFPITASDFVRQAEAFDRVTFSRQLDGGLRIRGMAPLRTLRIGAELGWPDLSRSHNFVGIRDLPQGRYLALGPGDSALLYLTASPPNRPLLESANARLVRWESTPRGVALRLTGHQPVRLVVSSPAPCRILSGARGAQVVRTVPLELHFPGRDTGEVELVCP